MTLESRYQPRTRSYNTLARVWGGPEVFDFAGAFFRLGFDDPELLFLQQSRLKRLLNGIGVLGCILEELPRIRHLQT
jgi:hypothetical protein